MKRVLPLLLLVVLGAGWAAAPAFAQSPMPTITWHILPGTTTVRVLTHWMNPSTNMPSAPVSGDVRPQEFGVFLPDMGTIGHFNVPPLQPNSFFDVFFDVPFAQLPPTTIAGAAAMAPCPRDTNWSGNIDVVWSGPGITGSVNTHYGQLVVCPGGGPSYIHIKSLLCAGPVGWSITGLCPGFGSTLVNEDFTPAPAALPAGWTGWICVTALSGVPVPTTCCFTVAFTCGGVPASIQMCVTTCPCQVKPTLSTVTWTNNGPDVHFQLRWTNPNPSAPSDPVSGDMHSQPFGVFAPTFGDIGQFNVPQIPPNSFFDVFFDVPLSSLPAEPAKQTSAPCPPSQGPRWNGNVDIQWSGAGGTGQVNKHFGDIPVCPGGGCSYLHVLTFCGSTLGATWSVAGLCPGFNATLVNEDKSLAPNPVPPGWTGFICITATAATPVPTTCCFKVTFVCDGVPGVIDVCAYTCQCPRKPTLSVIDWRKLGTTVRFHQRWTNPNGTGDSDPVSGTMNSQPFGVFLPDFGPIGSFNVPPIPPNSFFDVFFDVPIAQLPTEPAIDGPNTNPRNPCPTDTTFHCNVDINWNGPGGSGQVGKHYGDLYVCPGARPSYIHTLTFCSSAATWSITGLCPGFSATLVNEDKVTPAPNPVPPGWTGWICVSAAASTPLGVTCCFSVTFVCDNQPGVIDVCAITCDCEHIGPHLGSVDWTNQPGSVERFHLHFDNPAAHASDPASGHMSSQPFGVFLPDFGPIGDFQVPPLQPNSFFDVFFDVPLANLPPPPQVQLPDGGPHGEPCPPDNVWHGNVDVQWTDPAGGGTVGKHFSNLLVRPGPVPSNLHAFSLCPATAGSTWSITGVCPGWNVTLLNQDLSPAPNPVPTNWMGWISVSAVAGTPAGTICCFKVTFVCNGQPGVIDICAGACQWGATGVTLPKPGADFGIYAMSPNPTTGATTINFVLPRTGEASVDVFDAGGKRVRQLVRGLTEAGPHAILWDGRGDRNRMLPPGTYFITLRSNDRTATRKLVLVR